MDIKLNKYIIIIAAICTIIPFNLIIITFSNIMTVILLYLPVIIGYILYFIQYKKYTNKQQKLLKITVCISIIYILAGIWGYFSSQKDINTFNDITLGMVIGMALFYITYFLTRLLSLILCINLLKKDYSKIKTIVVIGIVIAVFILLPNVWNKSTYLEIKASKIFGDNYCTGTHYKGEFNRQIPWTCQLCGYSTDVTHSDENVPIICYSCSLSTGRCMECGLLEKDD